MSTKSDKDFDGMEYSIRERIDNIKNADVNAMKASVYEDALNRAESRVRNAKRTTTAVGVFALLSNAAWWIKTHALSKYYVNRVDELEESLDWAFGMIDEIKK